MTAITDQPGTRFSDDEVLAVLCQLGAVADPSSVQRALRVRHANVSLERLGERLDCLRREGLVRVVHSRTAGELRLRLTAAGVERLQALQRQPLRPPTD